jgi:hypothetical protein
MLRFREGIVGLCVALSLPLGLFLDEVQKVLPHLGRGFGPRLLHGYEFVGEVIGGHWRSLLE